MQTADVYDERALGRIRSAVEALTGGRIAFLERQLRWRPAWFTDGAVGETTRRLHLRGDRGGEMAIFPDLSLPTFIERDVDESGHHDLSRGRCV